MSLEVEIHPTLNVAIKVVVGAICIVGLGLMIRKVEARRNPAPLVKVEPINLKVIPNENNLINSIYCDASTNDSGSKWCDCLSEIVGVKRGVSTEGENLNVLTETFAIKVDTFDKWQEAIDQALHYALSAHKIPVVAIIVPDRNWAQNSILKDKIVSINKECLTKGVSLVLLIGKNP